MISQWQFHRHEISQKLAWSNVTLEEKQIWRTINVVSWLCILFCSKTKNEKKNVTFLNTPLLWHVCGCHFSAIKACNIWMVKLACSLSLAIAGIPLEAARPRVVNIKHVINSSKIILMTSDKWWFFGTKNRLRQASIRHSFEL